VTNWLKKAYFDLGFGASSVTRIGHGSALAESSEVAEHLVCMAFDVAANVV
jgi:hypothetical protein